MIVEAQRRVGRVDSGWDARTRRALNFALEEWARARPWPTLKRHETFLTDGTSRLVLPPRVMVVNWLADKTNLRPLYPDRNMDRNAPANFLAGTNSAAFRWNELNVQPVTSQPGSGSPSALVFQSQTVNPTTIHVTGLAIDTNASGTADYLHFAEEFVSVPSTDPVTGTLLYASVESIGKDAQTLSDIVVWDTSSNPIGRIPANGYRSEYRQLELLFTPPAGTQIEVGYLTQPPALATDPQVPHPAVDPNYLITYAASILAQEQNQSTIAELMASRAERILERKADQEIVQGEDDFSIQPDPRYWDYEDGEDVLY